MIACCTKSNAMLTPSVKFIYQQWMMIYRAHIFPSRRQQSYCLRHARFIIERYNIPKDILNNDGSCFFMYIHRTSSWPHTFSRLLMCLLKGDDLLLRFPASIHLLIAFFFQWAKDNFITPAT